MTKTKYTPSMRAQLITRRTYNRPLNDEGTVFETWEQTIDRVIGHQKWLWKRAQGRALNKTQEAELEELRGLLLERKVGVAGRTLWLGGTDIAKRRESSNFNCSFCIVETVNDIVDVLWLLLQGCGVGFSPKVGTLSGFTIPIKDIQIIRSVRTVEQYNNGECGRENNIETWDNETKTWTISIGDSAEAWAKAIGKLMAGKHAAKRLVLDLSEIRAAGTRLKGYGWISQGDSTLAIALDAMCKIMNQRAGQLLRKMDIHDVVNWLGTILSTRRSAEISLFEYGSPEWREFALCKKDYWSKGQPQRAQSNNSLLFNVKPSKIQLKEIFDMMLDAGGSEPGIINGQQLKARAPWADGLNPCAEILLANKNKCNLVTVDVAKFKEDPAGLYRALYIIARANYRQTCVDLRDGILQDTWHQNNDFLRLCGVSLTGQARRPDLTSYDYKVIRNCAVSGAYSMADELGTPRPKNVTTCKPEGCRPYDALTTTDKGILTLEELFASRETDNIWEDFKDNISVVQDGTTNKITKTFVNGVAPIKVIKMTYGMELKSTLNHPWYVKYDKDGNEVNAFVETKDLTEGMKLYVNTGVWKPKVINKVKSVDADLLWLWGYLWVSGSISSHSQRLTVSTKNLADLDKLVKTIETISCNINITYRYGRYTIEFGTYGLFRQLKSRGFISNQVFQKTVNIPTEIRKDYYKCLEFISGMIDGGLRVGSYHEDTIQSVISHIQHVAVACGIVLEVGSNSTLTLNVKSSDRDVIRYVMVLSREVFNKSALMRDDEFEEDTSLGVIQSIEDGGEVPTFDIEVENEHWYYNGSVKSHNTGSKCYDTTEGIHKPLAKYIFNNVVFGKHDPLISVLKEANYKMTPHPNGNGDWVVALPVAWEDVEFDKVGDLEVNLESAISQLNRYKMVMDNYVEQNCSITVSYDPSEVDDIVDWLYNNWDHYVGVSFLLRADPTKTAEDLGYPYLPQQPVTKEVYDAYVATLLPIDIENIKEQSEDEVDTGGDCAGGACPIR